jgi:hypothetical protein
MAEHKPCAKSAPNQSLLHRQFSGRKETLLRGENSILESISMGAPLPEVLNKLCAAIDLQIANLVSVITLADDQEHDLPVITERAVRFGLHVFWSASIPLRNEVALGWLEMYCCVSRGPTPFELQLIGRVTHLAALAIQRHNDEEDFESLSRVWTPADRRGSHEWMYLN